MSLFARWRARTRALLNRDDLDRDLDRELSDWVDELTTRYEAAGMSRDDARRRALIDTEGVQQVKDRVQDVRARWLVDRLAGHLRFDIATAFRALAATPVLSGAAILTMAVAAGVNLTMFGLIDRALLSPPAHVADPSRVFTMAFHAPGNDEGLRVTTSYPTFRTIRDQVPALSAAGFQRTSLTAVIDGDQRSLNAMLVTSTYFDVLGARSVLGAGLRQERDDAGPATAVISHAFWRSAFGSDPAAVGRRVSIHGLDYTIVGVMPEGFSGQSPTDVDIWVPFAAAMQDEPGWDHQQYRNIVSVVARLLPGETVASAEAQARRALNVHATLTPITGTDVGSTEQQVAWWLTGVSLLIFIIGLANAGTLLVVRASRRQQDVVIRTALGASRGRLAAQVMLEALMLSAIATGLSLVFVQGLDEPIRRVLFPDLVGRGGLGLTTIGAAALTGVLAWLVATFANIWQLQAQVRAATLAGAPRRSGRARMMTALLLVQTALSMVLLAGAGMFAQSLYKLAAQDFGMDMRGVLVVQFDRGPEVPDRNAIFTRALDQIRALPGVDTVTPIDTVPFTGFNVPPISVPGRPDPPSVGQQLPFMIASTPELLKILDVRVVEGRTFAAADDHGPLVVIVNQTMARQVWPGESAIGKCIRIGFDPDFDPQFATGPPTPSNKVPCREVIGVARDVRQRSVVPSDNEAHLMQYFVPFSQEPKPAFLPPGTQIRGLMLRASGGVDTLALPIRRLLIGDRSDLPFVRVVPYTQLLDRQLRPWQLGTTLLGVFSALALGVAAMGLYAAFAHAVAERRREMAIRLAIGARPGGVLTLVLREAMVMAAVGIAAGGTTAILAGRWVQSLLFETAPSDPLVLASAAAVMLIVALAATFWPARAASKADPNILLRV